MAALHPEVEFVGINFNPTHITQQNTAKGQTHFCSTFLIKSLGAAAVEHLFHAAHNCHPWQDAPPAPFMAPISQTLHHGRPFSSLRNSMFITDALFIPTAIPMITD
ncbi:MAG: hypothetical protein PHC35_07350 [Deltaproteobacteria bacterium]|nr:hypothetical protein [Deltaproteobacteria bacterium]